MSDFTSATGCGICSCATFDSSSALQPLTCAACGHGRGLHGLANTLSETEEATIARRDAEHREAAVARTVERAAERAMLAAPETPGSQMIAAPRVAKPVPVASDDSTPADAADQQPVRALELLLAAIGLAVIVIALFLPYADPASNQTFSDIVDNTMIQSSDGWSLLLPAFAVWALVWTYLRNSRTQAIAGNGALVIAYGVYYLHAKSQLMFYPVDANNQPIPGSDGVHLSPGIGIYAYIAGGLLLLLGGLIVRFPGRFYQGTEGGRTKRCPDCAENVHAEALVCKHCRYRFDTPAAMPEAA